MRKNRPPANVLVQTTFQGQEAAVVIYAMTTSTRAPSDVSTGVLPFFTECFGPRTALAGFIGMT
jgi:hypothetical protein